MSSLLNRPIDFPLKSVLIAFLTPVSNTNLEFHTTFQTGLRFFYYVQPLPTKTKLAMSHYGLFNFFALILIKKRENFI